MGRNTLSPIYKENFGGDVENSEQLSESCWSVCSLYVEVTCAYICHKYTWYTENLNY